jgi:hypothetical protein
VILALALPKASRAPRRRDTRVLQQRGHLRWAVTGQAFEQRGHPCPAHDGVGLGSIQHLSNGLLPARDRLAQVFAGGSYAAAFTSASSRSRVVSVGTAMTCSLRPPRLVD